ncbi:hypothetical protein OCH239_03175 [Roseivivax halodurans JCM 10272]|uniref:FAS1 domain-containing protein n=1 Tax=Roseivivax halodurans JCM 10272 TaxID=1449350 RepID=X7E4M2_9RHOB|nr:fasciclin domain-containing protein [Roseivivax halodurans]ETX10128.1 hypothetical protein OCH239_03175 [Roseivivax halodurans JCM 10272]
MDRRHFIAGAVGALIAAPARAAPRLDIPAELGSSAQFLPLVDALATADLLGNLAARGPFTVFAPTLEAFDRVGYGTLRALEQPARRAELRRLLAFHVVKGEVSALRLMGRTTRLETLIGRPLVVDGRGPGLRIGNARVGLAEITATNGLIHQIDRVLMPA